MVQQSIFLVDSAVVLYAQYGWYICFLKIILYVGLFLNITQRLCDLHMCLKPTFDRKKYVYVTRYMNKCYFIFR